jgi:type IV secretion system protein VirB8
MNADRHAAFATQPGGQTPPMRQAGAAFDPSSDPGVDPAQLARMSRKGLEQLARCNTWDSDRLTEAAVSVRRAWMAAGAGAVLAVLGLTAAVLAYRTPPPPPMAVVVDRSTGATQVVSRVTEAEVPALAVLDQHNAALYVRAREGYFPSLLQRDYDAVARMSTPDAFKGYGDRFVGDKAMHKTLGMTQEHRITIVSARPVRLPARADTGTSSPALSAGEMVITFDREIRSPNQPTHGHAGLAGSAGQGSAATGAAGGSTGAAGYGTTTLTRHVATLQYEYRPSAMSREIDRLENPFGFVVTAYRVDAELAAPMPSAQAQPPAVLPAALPTAAPAATAPITPITTSVPAATGDRS